VTNSARKGAQHVGNSDVVEKGARLGYAMSGLIHLLIGWIALKIAWGLGSGSGSADKTGALETVAGGTTGPFLLWLAIVGFLMLALWQVSQAVTGGQSGETLDRLKAAGLAILYLVFAWSAFKVVRGASGSDEQKTDSLTGTLMSSPGGRVLVGLVGLAIIAVAGYHVWNGWTKHFLESLKGTPAGWVVTSGRAGYLAKGVALGVAGLLFIGAALSDKASKAGGLDASLKELRDRPFGPYLLTLVAVGIAAYGIYSFARARHAKL
jgi:hypothetical protein